MRRLHRTARRQGKSHRPVALWLMLGTTLLALACASTSDLHRAAARGEAGQLDSLIDAGLSPNQIDGSGRTPLHLAAKRGQLASVERLLARGARVDARAENGATALLLAVDKGYVTVASALLDAGADPSLVNHNRISPLMLAAHRGDVDVAVRLLEAGADTAARSEDRETALLIAVERRRIDVVELLLANEADPNVPDEDGETPLYRATEQGDREIVSALLAAGADPNLPTADGDSPIIEALDDGDQEIVELLLAHGAKVSAHSSSADPAVVVSVRRRDQASLKLLIEGGADPDVVGADGQRALTIAVRNRDVASVKVLLEADADPDAIDVGGKTPLFVAALNRDIAIAKALLEADASPDEPSQNGGRPLMVAVNQRDQAMTKVLMEHGAEPGSTATALEDPSAYIAMYGYSGLVGAALANAADATRQAQQGNYAATPAPSADPNPSPTDARPPQTLQAANRPPIAARTAPRPAPGSTTYYSRRVAVVVGIDRYPAWPSLEGAGQDARAVSAAFREMGFDDVIEIYDDEATRRRILTVLGSDLAERTDEDSMAVIYFAGHGQTEPLANGGKRGYIVPVDADPDQVFATAISMDTLRSISSRLPAKQVYYAMDSCYSGLGFTRGISIPRTATEDYIRKITSLRAVQMITAGSEGEQALERDGQGIFTRYFLKALQGEADYDGDGWVTASEIGTFVRPQVTGASKRRQTPRFGTLEGSGEVAFAIGGR